MATIRTSDSQSIYDLKYPGAAIDAILDTAYDLQNAGYIFRGLASEYSNTPTERSWVLAGEGETGHGFTSPVPKGYIGVCVFNGTSWTGKLLKCVSIDSAPTSGSTNAVSSGGAYASISQLATTVNEALDNLTFSDATPSAFLGEYIKEKVSTTAGGIERILTFFNILAATAEKAGLLSAADKQKLDAILGNLRSLKIDDTTAYADLGTKIVESIKATIGGTEETISTFQILAATASKAGLLSAADKAKLDALWSSGYQYAGIATPSTTPISTTSKIFYIATEAGTYFNAVTVTQGINIIYKSGDAWSVAQVVGIDNEPTAGSDRLVKSGGVFGELALGAVYDVSAKNPTAGPNSDGKWESLSALLSDANLNTLIPTSVRKGGMSIKYVQSSDNKYVQYRLMANTFSATESDWQEDKSVIDTANIQNTDLALQDEYGNVLAKFAGGGIETKNFSSESVVQKLLTIQEGAEVNDTITEDTNKAFEISDEDENVVFEINNGNIKTKNFDSSVVSYENIKSDFEILKSHCIDYGNKGKKKKMFRDCY